jgi:hypothetical protein
VAIPPVSINNFYLSSEAPLELPIKETIFLFTTSKITPGANIGSINSLNSTPIRPLLMKSSQNH